ncbi:uncharacterized protein LOC116721912 [Xiphophorus hellerii]|uniref:uncharacterized protein LOC116721912 n=1 Tax=Xiphophorus hellerii TaxID=8084 RepID=UPI0013B3EC57|nr:uncharacterized protein LOC116721912 [Xiphophorus hellerii]
MTSCTGIRKPDKWTPSLHGCWRDNQAPRVNPSPWELKPAQWGDPTEPGVRHYSFVREQCGCVAGGDRARPFHSGIPHPLPHLQVKGQGYRRRRTVKYISVDEEEGCACAPNGYHLELRHPQSGHSHLTNGHCGPRRVVFKGEEERDCYLDQGRPKGGSEDHFNGYAESDKGFFPTEVPQKHLSQRRHRGSDITCSETSKTTTNNDLHSEESEVTRQRGRQDLVRDQIRQVVADLEEVLGGLKQVHVEMKEVVEQIDRLTANIDLSEEEPCITLESSNNLHDSASSGDFRLSPLPARKPSCWSGYRRTALSKTTSYSEPTPSLPSTWHPSSKRATSPHPVSRKVSVTKSRAQTATCLT